MRDEYDFKELKPIRNPYAELLKKKGYTINTTNTTINPGDKSPEKNSDKNKRG